jgi:alpha-glucosidase (family GH31 glycosyl hydrolase)
LPDTATPHCFYPANYSGYQVVHGKQDDLQLNLVLKRQIASGLANETDQVFVQVSLERTNFMLVTISKRNLTEPRSGKRTRPNRLYSRKSSKRAKPVTMDFQMTGEVINNQVHILRLPDRQVLWRADLATLLFSDTFIQIDTRLPSDRNVYGLGDELNQFRKTHFNHTRYTRWPRAGRPLVGPNLRVDQMAYVQQLPNSSFTYVVTLDNNYGADVILRPGPAITWRTLGGQLRFLIGVGPTPLQAVASFQGLAQRPIIPPLWGLGFQLGQDRFTTVAALRSLLETNLNARLPIDSIVIGLELWHRDRFFSIDPTIEAELSELLKVIKANRQRIVTTVHPAIDGSTIDQNITGVCSKFPHLSCQIEFIFILPFYFGLTLTRQSLTKIWCYAIRMEAFYDRDC